MGPSCINLYFQEEMMRLIVGVIKRQKKRALQVDSEHASPILKCV